MTRLTKVPVDQWDPALREGSAADAATPLEQGLLRIMAHSPSIAHAVMRFGGDLMSGHSLSRRLVELVRLRVAFHNQCRSCMAIRYRSALDEGLSEGAVCSLERPHEASDLSEAEKAAIAYADISSTDHLAIGDDAFDDLRRFFTEAQIVELGALIAFFIGFGRLSAAWDMTEELPDGYRDNSRAVVAPWSEASVVVRGSSHRRRRRPNRGRRARRR